MEAHEPYLPPYPFNRRFVAGRFNPWRVVRSAGRREEILSQEGRRRAEDLEILEGLYDGTIAYADERVRELTEAVDGVADSDATFVAVTSDHGDAFGEHGHLGHRLTLYEELLRVPLVIRFPRLFRAGSRVSTPVSIGDLFPTILDAAGLDAGGDSDFRTLRDRVEPLPIIAENTGPKSIGGLVSRTYRDGNMKLLWRADGRHELYDLRADPGERRSLVTDDPPRRGPSRTASRAGAAPWRIVVYRPQMPTTTKRRSSGSKGLAMSARGSTLHRPGSHDRPSWPMLSAAPGGDRPNAGCAAHPIEVDSWN